MLTSLLQNIPHTIEPEENAKYIHAKMLFSLGSDIIFHKFHMFSDIFWVIPIKIVETNHEGTKYNHKYSSKFENILKI